MSAAKKIDHASHSTNVFTAGRFGACSAMHLREIEMDAIRGRTIDSETVAWICEKAQDVIEACVASDACADGYPSLEEIAGIVREIDKATSEHVRDLKAEIETGEKRIEELEAELEKEKEERDIQTADHVKRLEEVKERAAHHESEMAKTVDMLEKMIASMRETKPVKTRGRKKS